MIEVRRESQDEIACESTRSGDTWTGGWPQTSQEFGAFVDVFQDRLLGYAFRRLSDIGDAEDVVQDVFVKAFVDRERFKNIEQVAPYIYRMAANACTDALRKRGRRPEIVSMEEIGESANPDTARNAGQQAAASEEVRRIEAILSDLPAKQAEILWLRFFDDLSLADVAEVAGCSLATAKSRLRYGLQKLRKLLKIRKETG
jgi:RNA polymerase sigma-70 factor (ECF subfamily)